MTAAELAGMSQTRSGPVLQLTLDRPEVHNALNGRLIASLGAAVAEAADDSSVRVVVLTGAGDKAFSAGADLDELAGLTAEQAHAVLRRGRQVMEAVERSPVPVIAAVNGVALGGGFELALACSFVLASTTASFGLPETGLGLMPGYGGTQRLPRLLGRQAALHLMLTGERMSADRAYALGLVAVPPVPPDAFADTVQEVAGRVASRGPRAQARVLDAVRASGDGAAGAQLESVLAALAVASPEAATGVQAFQERRTPEFEDGR